MNKIVMALGVLLLLSGCGSTDSDTKNQKDESKTDLSANSAAFDLQGHRGCRGLMPENTIEAFAKALDLGVKTLEMDVVISADGQVVVSHEPWFSHEICTDPSGAEISAENEMDLRIYAMDYEQIKRYDCGEKPHPRFPEQAKTKAYKPLLRDVIAAAEAHAKQTKRALPHYNIETKCLPQGDGIMHPGPEEFVELLMAVVLEMKITKRTIIQSFDIRTLQILEGKFPGLKLALLIENDRSPDENLAALGFTPDIYSPDFRLVDAGLVQYCKERNMKLIPWTVNETSEMQTLIDLGVDGLITDYPNRIPSNL